MQANGHWMLAWMNLCLTPLVIIFNSCSNTFHNNLLSLHPSVVKKRHLGQREMETKKSREDFTFNYSSVKLRNRCRVLEYFVCNQLTYGFSSVFLFSNLHQHSEEQLKTHMDIDFRPEPCELNSRRACQRSRRERERKRNKKRRNRKRTETSPNEHLMKTRCHPDPRYLRHAESPRRKKRGRIHRKTRGGRQKTRVQDMLLFQHIVAAFSTFSTKKLMPTSSVSVGPQSVGVLWCAHCSLLWSSVPVPVTKGIK